MDVSWPHASHFMVEKRLFLCLRRMSVYMFPLRRPPPVNPSLHKDRMLRSARYSYDQTSKNMMPKSILQKSIFEPPLSGALRPDTADVGQVTQLRTKGFLRQRRLQEFVSWSRLQA